MNILNVSRLHSRNGDGVGIHEVQKVRRENGASCIVHGNNRVLTEVIVASGDGGVVIVSSI